MRRQTSDTVCVYMRERERDDGREPGRELLKLGRAEVGPSFTKSAGTSFKKQAGEI